MSESIAEIDQTGSADARITCRFVRGGRGMRGAFGFDK
jgi:hypothetical protein